VWVQTGPEGEPRVVAWERRRLRVTTLRDHWRIDDEWWRHPIARRYFQVVLDDGCCLTLYHDLETGRWHRQSGCEARG
jgi:hypothetical protein